MEHLPGKEPDVFSGISGGWKHSEYPSIRLNHDSKAMKALLRCDFQQTAVEIMDVNRTKQKKVSSLLFFSSWTKQPLLHDLQFPVAAVILVDSTSIFLTIFKIESSAHVHF